MLLQIVPDNYLYARVALAVKDKSSLTDDSKKAELVEVLADEVKAQEVMDAARHSMGQDISPIDLVNIETFAKRVINLAEYRQKLHTYLLEKVRGGDRGCNGWEVGGGGWRGAVVWVCRGWGGGAGKGWRFYGRLWSSLGYG